MKMENKKISQNTRCAHTKLPHIKRSRRIAYICSLALLSVVVSYSYAGHVISDKKLATEIQGKGQFSQDTLGMTDGVLRNQKQSSKKIQHINRVVIIRLFKKNNWKVRRQVIIYYKRKELQIS